MIFPTLEFAGFFAVVMLASWLLMPTPKYWKPFIIGVSLCFYAYADWRWVFILIFSVVANQTAAQLISKSNDPLRRKQFMFAAVAINLGVLGVYKYLGFFVESINSALDTLNLGVPIPLLEIALPIGISFFTFQAISYVIDVYRREYDVAKPVDYAVYATFFPHLVAGPIVRAREFIPQLATPRDPRRIPATAAFFLIVGGLFKKVVLADMIATRIVDPVFASPGSHSAIDVAVGIVGYAAQIYCDFSAYTDIAIGVALLLGFRFPQNFDRPYSAASLAEFWHRWHMTLSRWLRDYLYIPLGGNRKGVRRTYANLMITMLLGGLWHGAAWTFVAWGAIHGSGLAAEKWLGGRRKILAQSGSIDLREPSAPVQTSLLDDPAGESPPIAPADRFQDGAAGGGSRVAVLTKGVRTQVVPGALRVVDALVSRTWPRWALWSLTFSLVCFAWVFFRAASIGDAFAVLWQLVAGWTEATTLVTPTVLVVVAAAMSTQFIPARMWQDLQARFSQLNLVVQGCILGFALVLMNAIIGQQGVAPFIYFSF